MEIAANLPKEASFEIHDKLCEFAGLDDFVGCSTGEVKHPILKNQARRPCPTFSTYDKWNELFQLFQDYAPTIYELIKERIHAGIQTFDKNSRLGAPFFEVVENKVEACRPFWDQLLKGDMSLFSREDVYVITNIRVQPERLEKERLYPYLIDGEYVILPFDKYTRWMDDVKRVGSRVRMVFNYPGPANLLLQCVDTQIHNVYVRSPFAHHAMAKMVGQKLPGEVLFLDVSNFDFCAGAILPHRAQFIGGLYGQIMMELLNCRYLSMGLDGITYFIKTKGDVSITNGQLKTPESLVQLGTGISCVAPVAKEIMHVIYTAFVQQEFKVSKREAAEMVIDQRIPDLKIMNYGDDNVIYSENPKLLSKCLNHMNKYMPVEEETPPSFLGYTYPPFQLKASSYILNEWESERAPLTRFRPYPFFGMVERDKVYMEQTVTNEVRDIMVYKQGLIDKFGYSRDLIERAARREEADLALKNTLEKNKNSLLGKNYLITDEEKLASSQFMGLGESRVSQIMATLLKGSSLEKTYY